MDSARFHIKIYIRAQFSGASKSSITKIRKQYFLDPAIFLATYFFRFLIFFFLFLFLFFFLVNILYWFYANVEKVYKCDWRWYLQEEFKTNSEIMKMNRNYQKVDKKIWRVLKCKEIVGLRDFLYNVCTIRLLKVCYHR